MFWRGKQTAQRIDTLIGAGTRLEGNLIATGGVHLEGRIHGNVLCPGGGAAVLSIAAKGLVEGEVEVPHVIVHGEVRGDIRASGKVDLGPTARVRGNVTYGVIEMAAGAVIEGRLVAAREGGAPVAADAVPPAATP
jgi:cytoskeletal protein CcmA (bactofilin family)